MANYIKGTKIQENSISETKLDSSLQSWKETVTNHINNNDNPHNITKSSIGLDNVTNDAQVKRSELGVANGVATLDSTGKVPSGQLPSYVDDVIEGYLYNGVFYKDTSYTTSIVGESGKIYIDLPTNKTYRWTGSVYGVISETIALGETSSTAYRGDRGKIAYDHSQSAHAPSNAQANVIETIKVNGTALTPNSKAVDITIPTVGNGTITIKQGGTSKGTFTTNQNGNTTIELTDTNTTYTAGDGLSLSGTTFSNNGVRSIATGTTNGTISVNTNGNISNIEVYGLKSAAYTNSSDYAAASHTHTFASLTDKPTTISGYGITDAYTASTIDSKLNGYLPLSGGTISGSGAELLKLDSSNSSYNAILFKIGGVAKSEFGFTVDNCSYIYDYTSNKYIGIDVSGTPFYGAMNGDSKYTLIHSGNYNSYAPTLTGTGASGTWGINISGNAATATKLANSRTIWGQSFDGTGNVGGALTEVTTITTSGQICINTSSSQRNNYNEGIRCNLGGSDNWASVVLGGASGSTNGAGSGVYSLLVNSSLFRIRQNSTEVLCINTSNNVGIGTTSPSYKLDVNGDAHSSGSLYVGTTSGANLRLLRSDLNYIEAGTAGGFLGFTVNGGGHSNLAMQINTDKSIAAYGNITTSGGITASNPISSSSYISASGGIYSYNDVGPVLQLYGISGTSYAYSFYNNGDCGKGVKLLSSASGATPIVFDYLGNVGIGTTSPSYKLDVNGSGRFTSLNVNGSVEVGNLTADDTIINGEFSINNGTFRFNGLESGYYGNMVLDDNYSLFCKIGVVDYINSLTIKKATVASTGTITYEPIIIFNSSGYIGIGGSSNSYKLYVNGTIGCISVTQLSDIKYKKNIKQIEYKDAINVIESLNPVTWDWNENTEISGSSSGFIAQEVKDIIPNAVSEGDENTLSLDYTQLHSYEIKVIQEQQKEIKDLKQRLEVLENLVLQLTNREI